MDDLGKTVPKNVSVTIMVSVCRPLDSVSAALDTQETGVRTSVQLVLMVLAVRRPVAVRTTASATTPTGCVCVSQDTQEEPVTSHCVLKATTAYGATGSVRATVQTPAAATPCQESARASPVGRVSTAMRRAPLDFMASPAGRCASARTVLTAAA